MTTGKTIEKKIINSKEKGILGNTPITKILTNNNPQNENNKTGWATLPTNTFNPSCIPLCGK
jgi:hypothetical protein